MLCQGRQEEEEKDTKKGGLVEPFVCFLIPA